MGGVGTKGRYPTGVSPFLKPPNSEGTHSARQKVSVPSPGFCCPPATVAGIAQGVRILEGQDSQSNYSHGFAADSCPVPNVVGVGVGLSRLPCPCRLPWPGTAFLLNELSPQGCGTWGQAKTQLLGPGPLTGNLRTCPWLILLGPQSCPLHMEAGARLSHPGSGPWEPNKNQQERELVGMGPGQQWEGWIPGVVGCRPSQLSWPLPPWGSLMLKWLKATASLAPRCPE